MNKHFYKLTWQHKTIIFIHKVEYKLGYYIIKKELLFHPNKEHVVLDRLNALPSPSNKRGLAFNVGMMHAFCDMACDANVYKLHLGFVQWGED